MYRQLMIAFVILFTGRMIAAPQLRSLNSPSKVEILDGASGQVKTDCTLGEEIPCIEFHLPVRIWFGGRCTDCAVPGFIDHDWPVSEERKIQVVLSYGEGLSGEFVDRELVLSGPLFITDDYRFKVNFHPFGLSAGGQFNVHYKSGVVAVTPAL